MTFEEMILLLLLWTFTLVMTTHMGYMVGRNKEMTAKEAVMIIRALPEAIWEELCDDENAAMNLAIEALEKEAEVEEKTAWVKEALDKGWFDKMREPTPEERQSVNDYIESISEELDLKPCEDAVSRQAVIDEIRFGQSYITRISPDGELTDLFTAENEALEKAVKRVEALPSAEKTGHWIIVDDCEKFIAKCSECGRIEDSRMINKYHYCHCGAKMEDNENG